MVTGTQQFAERLAAVRAEIARAAERAGRQPGDVTLVVVTKAAPPAVFPALLAAGVSDVGESRVQETEGRMAGMREHFRWHLVGHLQANKARRAVELFDVFHGIDSSALLLRLDRLAGELGRRPEVLLQVNVSGERSKHGLSPAALPAALDAAASLQNARVRGLMTMAPLDADPEAARPVFAALARLAAACARPADGLPLTTLSMGMSDDFVPAIEEGATCVRVGRRLVGGLFEAGPDEPARPASR